MEQRCTACRIAEAFLHGVESGLAKMQLPTCDSPYTFQIIEEQGVNMLVVQGICIGLILALCVGSILYLFKRNPGAQTNMSM